MCFLRNALNHDVNSSANSNNHSTPNAGAYLSMYHCCWHGNTSIFTCLTPGLPLIIILLLLALIALNPIGFVITYGKISNLRSMYELFKMYDGYFC